MAKMDERAEMIGSSILAQAEHERKELIESAWEIRQHEIERFEDNIVQEMFSKVQKQASALRRDTVRAVSAAKVAAHRDTLRRREDLMRQAFAVVRSRLIEYAGTAGYRESLLAELKSVAGSYDHSASTVFLKESDMELAGKISELLKGCSVEADNTIKCGGWKLKNSAARILIDETLDSRLTAQKPWFLQNSGLEIGRKESGTP